MDVGGVLCCVVYCCLVQNCAVLSRYQCIEQTVAAHCQSHGQSQRTVFITERCLSSDHGVFTKMLHQGDQRARTQKIDTLEMALYEKWLRHLLRSSTPLAAVVHVDTPPDLCAARVKSRHRGGEEGVSVEYLRSVGQFQQAWVDGLLASTPVHTTGSSPTEEAAVAGVEAFVQGLLAPVDLLLGGAGGDDEADEGRRLVCKL